MKKSDTLSTTIAVIGCLSGVTSLGWQIWSQVKTVPELLTFAYSHTADYKSKTFTVEATATNIGQRSVYIRDVQFRHNMPPGTLIPDNRTFTPAGAIADAALEPGAYRVYRSQPINFDTLKRFSDLQSKPDVRVETTTSLNHEFNSPDLSGSITFAAAVYLDPTLR